MENAETASCERDAVAVPLSVCVRRIENRCSELSCREKSVILVFPALGSEVVDDSIVRETPSALDFVCEVFDLLAQLAVRHCCGRVCVM